MEEPRRRRKRILIGLIPVLAILIWYASRAVGHVANLRAFVIPPGSNSMAPALLPGDRIVADMSGGTPRRGEIWLYQDPRGTTIIKRVIGLPGETVEVAGGQVLIDGKPINEPYLTGPTSYTMAPVVLGPDQYFVLGDGRNVSTDSHITGPVEASHLMGKAITRLWPSQRIGPVQ